jgi:hypothetical protein
MATTVLWVMCLVVALAAVVLVVLLKGVLGAAKGITGTVTAIGGVGQAASKDLDAVIALVTTQNYISQTVAGLANYGGSLDAALPNA